MPTKHRAEIEKMKMTGWHWFPFDVVDWLTSDDILQMSAAERGVYITLLCMQWRDGFVPSRPQSVAKVSGFRPEMLRRWFSKWSHLFPISSLNAAHLVNAKLNEIAIEVGNPKAEGGTEERREEESTGEYSTGERERKESPLPRKEKDNPSGASDRKTRQPQQPPSSSAAPKVCRCTDGLCDWSDPIPGVANPSSIGDAVYYQRHIKKNDYFIPKLSRGYVLQQWQRIIADTPEDYAYDADPMFKERRIPADGENQPSVTKIVLRGPKNAKERALLIALDPDKHAKWLFDPTCDCKEGWVFVSDFADDERQSMRKMGHSELCECVTRERADGASA